MINYLLGGLLILIAVLIIKKIISDIKKGKSSCGLNCPHCNLDCSFNEKIKKT